MGRTVGSRRGLPCSEAVKRDVQREQLPCCTLLPTGPCFCAWIADVLLQLCGTNEPLPAPAPLHPLRLRAQVLTQDWVTVPSAGFQLTGDCVLGRQTVANLSLGFWGH